MRFHFDRPKFFEAYRTQFSSLNQQQVDGLNYLLDAIERDPHLTRIEEPAYMLGTTKHETAHTFQPIHEYGGRAYFVRRYGSQTKVGKRLGNDTAEEGAYYAGRGDVQLTGETNYEKAEDALRAEYPEIVADFEARTGKKFDLTVGDQAGDIHDPDNAMDPAIAYAIMSYGMRVGMFTGLGFGSRKFVGLSGVSLYTAWRKIINGTDRDGDIAKIAAKFEKILRAAFVTISPANSAAPQNVPEPQRLDSNLGENAAEDLTGTPPTRPIIEDGGPPFGGAITGPNAEGSEGKEEPPAPPPVEVKAATPSWTSRISSGLAYISGLGISLGTFFQGKLESITINQVIIIAILIGVGYAIHHFSTKRAQERTKMYFANAQNPTTPDIIVT